VAIICVVQFKFLSKSLSVASSVGLRKLIETTICKWPGKRLWTFLERVAAIENPASQPRHCWGVPMPIHAHCKSRCYSLLSGTIWQLANL